MIYSTGPLSMWTLCTQTLAPTCGSEKTSCMLFTGPYGNDAPSRTVNHSVRLFSPILQCDVNSVNRRSHTDWTHYS